MKTKNLLSAAMLLLFLSCGGKDKLAYVQVSKENPHYFALSDGSTFVPVGPNICFNRFTDDEETVLSLYEEMFRKLSENGGNYTRIWIGYPFFELERNVVGEYSDVSVRRIERLLDLARRYGIRLKFCIEYFRQLADPASIDVTQSFFFKPVYGAYFRDMDEYCKTDRGQKVFLDKMRFFASRYSDEPIVFGWELWNEVNCLGVSDGTNGAVEWTRLMLPKVKELFPHHLVMQSMGSFDREDYREWYVPLEQMKDNEVAQVHRYLDMGAQWDICHEAVDTLVFEAMQEIFSMVDDKPVVLAETGCVKPGHTGPSDLYPRDTLGILLHDAIFCPFFCGSAATGQNWHWDTYVHKNDLWWQYGRFVKAIDGVDPVKEDLRPTFFQKDDVRYYALQGKTVTLIWARDRLSNWKTELVEGIPAMERSVSLDFSALVSHIQSAEIYDPWNDTTEVLGTDGEVPFTFTRSAVIRLMGERSSRP